MLQQKTIAFIGAGNMAEALVSGLLKQRATTPGRMVAADVDVQRLNHVRKTYGIRIHRTNQHAAESADIILLAVKPQAVHEVVSGLDLHPRAGRFIISVAAGLSIASIMAGVRRRLPVVRAMPNTASVVLEGATALAGGPGVTSRQMRLAHAVFEAVGRVVVVPEPDMDAVTGLSGGGVAYVYAFIEALADGGVKMGLSRAHAQLLAAQTVLGGAAMVRETQEHPGVLKDRVASPGGTTIAGLHQLEKGRLRGTVISAVESATARCRELGRRTRGHGSSSAARRR